MASLSELRDGVATRLQTITGLRVTSFQPDAIRPPMAFVLPDGVEFDLNANRGADTTTFLVTVIVGRADDRAAQANLDGYVFGATSVKTAVEADRTLGGVANTCRVTEMRNYGAVTYGDQVYLGCEFILEVVS
jgi:hypothetical protein